jgi:predicted SprT family Zn-dependent metalloprotease
VIKWLLYHFAGIVKNYHELALNPDEFTRRTDEMILSTLAHEMYHVWQQTHGTPPRRRYHALTQAAEDSNPTNSEAMEIQVPAR